VEIKVAKREDRFEWNKLVKTSPYSTLFHTWEWLKIAEKYTKWKLKPIMIYKGEKPVCLYPLFYLKKKFIKMAFSPPPRALQLYLGPLFIDHDSTKQSKRESTLTDTQKKVDELNSKYGVNYIRVRTVPGLLDCRYLKWNGYEVEPMFTYMIDLSAGIESIWNGLRKELRKNIKKAINEGIRIEEGSIEDLKYIDDMLTVRFKEQGMSRKGYEEYFSELYKVFSQHFIKVFVTKYKGERVGGQIVLCHGDRISLWVGSPKTNLLRGIPNDLLQWEIIKWAHENRYKYVEIMDDGNNPRLRHYKAKFNPYLVPWYSAVKYSPKFVKYVEHYAKKVLPNI